MPPDALTLITEPTLGMLLALSSSAAAMTVIGERDASAIRSSVRA